MIKFYQLDASNNFVTITDPYEAQGGYINLPKSSLNLVRINSFRPEIGDTAEIFAKVGEDEFYIDIYGENLTQVYKLSSLTQVYIAKAKLKKLV